MGSQDICLFVDGEKKVKLHHVDADPFNLSFITAATLDAGWIIRISVLKSCLSFNSPPTAAGAKCCKLPFIAPEEDKDDKQEVTVRLPNAKEISIAV